MCDYSLHSGVVFCLMMTLSLIYKIIRAGVVGIYQELLSFCGGLGPGRVGRQTAGLLRGTGTRRGANNECERERIKQVRRSKQARMSESNEQELRARARGKSQED